MKKFVLLTTLLLIALIAAPTNAQSSAFALFLGQNGGHTLLYRASLDGKLSTVSSPGSGDVLLYAADSSAAAYVTRGANNSLTLYLTDLSGQSSSHAALTSTQATQIVLNDQSISLVTVSADGKPTLLTFDRATLAPVATRSTQHKDSILTVQAQGRWVLAYNPSGAIDVFSLPTADEMNFDLVDFGYSTPLWSPGAGQLEFVGSVAASPNERFIDLLDFDTATSQRFPLPSDYTSGTARAQWSDHGHYILTSSSSDPGTILITSVSDGSQKTLSESGFILTPIGWSFDDMWLLYTAQINAASPVDLFAYNVVDGERDPVHTLTNAPLTAHWASDADQLLVIAQGSDQSLGLFTVTAPSFDTWQSLISSSDGQIVTSSIRWTGTTLLLEYGGTLLTMDTSSRSVLRLSPQSLSVVPGTVQLIG